MIALVCFSLIQIFSAGDHPRFSPLVQEAVLILWFNNQTTYIDIYIYIHIYVIYICIYAHITYITYIGTGRYNKSLHK